jgi:hypothetical protein
MKKRPALTQVRKPKSLTGLKFLLELDRDGDHWFGPPTVRGGVGLRIDTARAVYAVYNGTVPTGVNVIRTCGVPECLNPAHLALAGVLASKKVASPAASAEAKVTLDQVPPSRAGGATENDRTARSRGGHAQWENRTPEQRAAKIAEMAAGRQRWQAQKRADRLS